MSRYIDAEALGIGKANPDVFEDAEYAHGWNAAIEMIEATPAADVAEVRHGEWINTGAYVCGEYEFECTECGYTNWHTSEANEKYCPGCGARMDGDKE
nr:MAG TPA: DNA-directed RNA polymerase [Caudoviricetes sp.]